MKSKLKMPANLSKCDNCGKEWSDYALEDIRDYSMRVGGGCRITPSGECPECGALCYPLDEVRSLDRKDQEHKAALRKLTQAIKTWEKAADGDSNDEEHDAGFDLAEAAKAVIRALGK